MIIRRQLVFAISGVFLLSVALLSALAVPQLERTVLERTNRLMLTEATRAAENIDHRLLSRGLILQTLAMDMELTRANPDDPAFQERLNNMALRFNDQFLSLYCGFEDKRHLTTTTGTLPENFDPTTRPWYKAAMKQGGLTFTEPYTDIRTGRLSISIAHPMNTPVKAVLGTDIFLDSFARLARETFIHPKAEVMLVSQAGKVLFASDNELASAGMAFDTVLQGALADALASSPPTDGHIIGTFSTHGQVQHWLAVPVSTTGWKMLVYLPQTAFEEEKRRLLEYIGFAVLFGLAGIMLAIYWLVGKITYPLEVISAQAMKFQPDQPDVTFSTADGALEVRRLAESLDLMRGRLLGAIGEKNDLLEETRAQNEEIQALYSQVKAMNESLLQAYQDKDQAYIETIKALSAAIEANDLYTRGHSDRVRRYAMMFAEALQLDEKNRLQLEYAAILHDIGKIGVPLEVLNKPGNLTPCEYEQIKRHPVVGWRILSNISHLASVNQAVRQHHEKMDGTGYPDGVKQDDICLMARILSIADAFDAMTSERPYRPAMSKEEACVELKDCAGRQFDPQLVALFCDKLAPEIELP